MRRLPALLGALLGLLLAGRAAFAQHDGAGPPDPEPPPTRHGDAARHEVSDPEWSGETEDGTKFYWEEDSPGNPNGEVDSVSVLVKGASVLCWGSFYDGDGANGASDVSGGATGASTYYEHATHTGEVDVWWKASVAVEFWTSGSMRGNAKVSAKGYCKAFGSRLEYEYNSAASGSSTSTRTRTSTTVDKSSSGVSVRAHGGAEVEASPTGRTAEVDAKAKADGHFSASSDSEDVTTEQDVDATSAGTNRPIENREEGELRGSGDGCEFRETVWGMHHLTLSGKATGDEGAAVAEVHESSTRADKPRVKWMEGSPPRGYFVYADPVWDVAAGTPPILSGGATDPSDGAVFRLDLQPAFGLAAEAGTRAGELTLWVETPLAGDASFALAQTGAGAVALAADTITIAAGRRFAFAAFTLAAEGEVTVTATRLDAAGLPTAFSLSRSTGGAGVESRAGPEIYVAWPGLSLGTVVGDGETVRRTVQAGTTPPPIVVRRCGFAGYDTEATTVSISVTDPSGVLGALPADVTIPAGEDRVAVAVPLTGAAGPATITFTHAGEPHELALAAVEPAWAANVPRIEVPANARMVMLEARLNVPAPADRPVTFASQDPGVIRVDSGWEARVVYEGWTSVAAPLSATAPGVTTVRISGGGLPALAVPVTVRASEVEVSATAVTLSGTLGSHGGACILGAPEGQVWAAFTPQPGTSGFLSVSGLGTGLLTITFADGVERSLSTIVSAYTFGGDREGRNTVVVFDGLHLQAHEVRYIYEVEVE